MLNFMWQQFQFAYLQTDRRRDQCIFVWSVPPDGKCIRDQRGSPLGFHLLKSVYHNTMTDISHLSKDFSFNSNAYLVVGTHSGGLGKIENSASLKM